MGLWLVEGLEMLFMSGFWLHHLKVLRRQLLPAHDEREAVRTRVVAASGQVAERLSAYEAAAVAGGEGVFGELKDFAVLDAVGFAVVNAILQPRIQELRLLVQQFIRKPQLIALD